MVSRRLSTSAARRTGVSAIKPHALRFARQVQQAHEPLPAILYRAQVHAPDRFLIGPLEPYGLLRPHIVEQAVKDVAVGGRGERVGIHHQTASA